MGVRGEAMSFPSLHSALMMGAASGKNPSKIKGRVQPRVTGSQANEDLRRTWTRAADLISKTYWTTAMETRNKQSAARLAQYGQPTGSGWEHPDYYHKPKAVWRASLAPKPAPAAEPQRVARPRTGPAPPALRNTRRYASALGGGTIRQPKLKRGG